MSIRLYVDCSAHSIVCLTILERLAKRTIPLMGRCHCRVNGALQEAQWLAIPNSSLPNHSAQIRLRVMTMMHPVLSRILSGDCSYLLVISIIFHKPPLHSHITSHNIAIESPLYPRTIPTTSSFITTLSPHHPHNIPIPSPHTPHNLSSTSLLMPHSLSFPTPIPHPPNRYTDTPADALGPERSSLPLLKAYTCGH